MVASRPGPSQTLLFPLQEARLLVAAAYRHTEKVLRDNLDKLQAVSPHHPPGPCAYLSRQELGLPSLPC